MKFTHFTESNRYLYPGATIFSIIGFAIEFILILAIAGFKFQNFQIILGGVFFGIGIGNKYLTCGGWFKFNCRTMA